MTSGHESRLRRLEPGPIRYRDPRNLTDGQLHQAIRQSFAQDGFGPSYVDEVTGKKLGDMSDDELFDFYHRFNGVDPADRLAWERHVAECLAAENAWPGRPPG